VKTRELVEKVRARWVRLKKKLRYTVLFILNPRANTTPYKKGSDSLALRHDLQLHTGIEAEPVWVDLSDYTNFVELAGYQHRLGPSYYQNYFGKKTLEHYLTFKFLAFRPNDVLVDVGTESSPFPGIVEDLIGCTVYRQDLSYPHGIFGKRIGGNAADLPLDDDSVSKMTLHCAFEHFEGDSDTKLIHEAARVLSVGGILCIVPLYLSRVHTNQVSPTEDLTGLVLDTNAQVIYKPFWPRFERYYDIRTLQARVLEQSKRFIVRLYHVENSDSIDKTGAVKFMILFKKVM